MRRVEQHTGAVVWSLRLGEFAFKPATTNAGQVVAERCASCFRFEEGAERESERASTP